MMSIVNFIVTSDGSKLDNPRWMTQHQKNLKRKQQQLSRKQKGSNNRNKARKKVAKVHHKVARCREDFLHKLSRRIVDENQVICVENLNIKGMVKNHHLAKAISEVGWERFLKMLEYKAEQDGKIYIEVDRFFPSSKTCNVCLNQIGSLPLEVRHWTCPHCGTVHDRDVNAAIELREERLRILTGRINPGGNLHRTPFTCGTRGQAYCPDVRPNRRGRKKSTVGQFVG
jgi:putative transposase